MEKTNQNVRSKRCAYRTKARAELDRRTVLERLSP